MPYPHVTQFETSNLRRALAARQCSLQAVDGPRRDEVARPATAGGPRTALHLIRRPIDRELCPTASPAGVLTPR